MHLKDFAIPILLIIFIIEIEILGYYCNHFATDIQTKWVKRVIIRNISDAKIVDEYSETGNTTGTSNHVDCLSRISFTSEEDEVTILNILLERDEYFELEKENGVYTATICTDAPFRDNIEGH